MVLVHRRASSEIVADGCALAAAAGVRGGMTLAHARALLGQYHLIVRDHQPVQDAQALERLAVWATRFSPIVAADPPDGLTMNISGCERLLGSEEGIGQQVAEALARLGIAARVAVGPTIGCAWAVARYGGKALAVVRDGEARNALGGLPVAVLRVEEAVARALAEVGVERIEQLWSLPRRAVAQRFGPQVLRRLDAALGVPASAEVLEPVRPREPAKAVRDFDGPVRDLEVLLLASRQLLEALTQQLWQREAGATRLALRVERYAAQAMVLDMALSRPTRQVRHLWAMLKERVERLPLDAGVERLVLTAAETGKLAHQQIRLGGGGAAADEAHRARAWGELVDVLTNRLGGERLTRMVAVATHWPRAAYRQEAVTADDVKRVSARSRLRGGAKSDVAPAQRPTMLLEAAQEIQVIAGAPEGAPSWLRWRGQECRVVAAAGPERIAARWWAPEVSKRQTRLQVERDYFRVQDETGRWLWVYRELHTGRWYVEGLWA